MARAPSTPIQSSAVRISSAIAGGIELSRSGRLSVIVATWSATSSLIVSKLGLSVKIGRAPVCTPVTHAHLVCRLLLEHKKTTYNHILTLYCALTRDKYINHQS